MRIWSIIPALCLAACSAEAPLPQEQKAEAALDEKLPVMGPERTILAFGDSLFAGYNLAEEEGYPEKLEAALRARGVNASVIDAGVSGDTSAAGLQRIGFVLDNLKTQPDLALVELGGNDLLRGLSPEQTRENLTGIMDALAGRGIPVLVMGMQAPPNMGADYRAQFNAIYPALAERYEAALIPFWVESLVGRNELIQQDRIHPTAEGIELLVADTIDAVTDALPEEEAG